MGELQQERNVLKEAAEESQVRIDQLQRTQRVIFLCIGMFTGSTLRRN